MADILVTAIRPQDRARWAELWRGYLTFYETELPPEAGIAVYVRGESGKLAAARIYDDADPPLDAARSIDLPLPQ